MTREEFYRNILAFIFIESESLLEAGLALGIFDADDVLGTREKLINIIKQIEWQNKKKSKEKEE